jgi:putative peptide zinc metalloprotease protein
MVRLATDRVEVRMTSLPEYTTTGKIIRQVPAGDEYLPSRALTTEGGGQISVDPRDVKGVKTMERMFQFDIELAKGMGVDLYGQRVHVRFNHQMEPLAMQWYRGIRQLFLTHFNV